MLEWQEPTAGACGLARGDGADVATKAGAGNPIPALCGAALPEVARRMETSEQEVISLRNMGVKTLRLIKYGGEPGSSPPKKAAVQHGKTIKVQSSEAILRLLRAL